MIFNTPISILVIKEAEDVALASFYSYLSSIPHIRLSEMPQLPRDLSAFDVVVTDNTRNTGTTLDRLSQFVRAGGGWHLFVNLSDHQLPHLFGVQPDRIGPATELRVLFENAEHPLAARLPDATYLNGRYHALNKTAEDAETILYADWQYSHKPVLTYRRIGQGHVACTSLQAYSHPVLQRILSRLLYQLAGRRMTENPLGIGILGYAPSVGRIHGLGAQMTPGLALRAVCDLNPNQLDRAQSDFPGVKTYESAEVFAEAADVDLVIVATPPDSHARLCLQIMSVGKHVVCEKPLALNGRETDALKEMAAKKGVHLSCHQNRRWDSDYLAIKQSLTDGLIGDLFYLESFVGGFHHPCGYWHSHAPVSGGTSYDWGAHYIDWIVSLIPERVETVVATRHKRVWQDVTNADQERIQVRFYGGKEAEFMHSDIAAARKPKWFLLGTEGAIVGNWRDVTSYEFDPDHYYQRHDIPATEMVPDLTVFRRHHSGNVIRINPAIPDRDHYQFHSNLADHLLLGEPIAAPLSDSVKVVAILEAAARSMVRGGTVEGVNDRPD
ncbi:MAG: Gfo/Idh/MocA family oxidoreductase [Desulfobacteraceae bacterium]|jgi:predicted dehydrogenase|nr:Gfo/Idh/MocA family oxidoreductase [Desulfobacteraceae bacterium]